MAFSLLALTCSGFCFLLFCFVFLSPDSVCPDNLPDQLWCCLAVCVSSGVAVFPDFLYDFLDYPLHKFLHSGKSNIHRFFVAFCWFCIIGKLFYRKICLKYPFSSSNMHAFLMYYTCCFTHNLESFRCVVYTIQNY